MSITNLVAALMTQEKPLISNTEKTPPSSLNEEAAPKARARLREYMESLLRGKFDFDAAEKRLEEVYDGTSELPQAEQTALLRVGNVLHDLEEDAATRPFVETVRRLSEVKARREVFEDQLNTEEAELSELRHLLEEKIPPQARARELGIAVEEGKEAVVIDKAWERFATREGERREARYAVRRAKDILSRFGKEKTVEAFIGHFRQEHKDELDVSIYERPQELRETLDTLNALRAETDQEQIITNIIRYFSPLDISLVNSILWEAQKEEERSQRETLKKAKQRRYVSDEEAAQELTQTLEFYEKFLASPPAAFTPELKRRMVEKDKALEEAIIRQKSKLDAIALEKELDLMHLFSVIKDLAPDELVTYGLDTRRLKELLDPLTVSVLEEKLRERIIAKETKRRRVLIWNGVKSQWDAIRASRANGIEAESESMKRYEQSIAEILKKYREYREVREKTEQELKELFPSLGQSYTEETEALPLKSRASEARLDRLQKEDLTPALTYNKIKRRRRKAIAKQNKQAKKA